MAVFSNCGDKIYKYVAPRHSKLSNLGLDNINLFFRGIFQYLIPTQIY